MSSASAPRPLLPSPTSSTTESPSPTTQNRPSTGRRRSEQNHRRGRRDPRRRIALAHRRGGLPPDGEERATQGRAGEAGPGEARHLPQSRLSGAAAGPRAEDARGGLSRRQRVAGEEDGSGRALQRTWSKLD